MQFPWGSSELHEEAVRAAKAKIFDQSYSLFGSDIDPAMLSIARENARHAGVADTITFSTSSLIEVQYPE